MVWRAAVVCYSLPNHLVLMWCSGIVQRERNPDCFKGKRDLYELCTERIFTWIFRMKSRYTFLKFRFPRENENIIYIVL